MHFTVIPEDIATQGVPKFINLSIHPFHSTYPRSVREGSSLSRAPHTSHYQPLGPAPEGTPKALPGQPRNIVSSVPLGLLPGEKCP